MNESGEAITETLEGVTMPADCSFEKVNDWIHGIDVHFEEVQVLCLGIASENDKLRRALNDIKKHQEMAMNGTPMLSSTWCIADKSLKTN